MENYHTTLGLSFQGVGFCESESAPQQDVPIIQQVGQDNFCDYHTNLSLLRHCGFNVRCQNEGNLHGEPALK